MTDSVMRTARAAVIEALYEADTSDHPARDAFERRLGDEAVLDLRATAQERVGEFGRAAIPGIAGEQTQIDSYIAEAAPRYPVETLAVVDRSILRLAIWELLAGDSAPVAAVVNEAVELARRYGGESSPAFVNGVLRTISERITAERARASAD